jgi:two-component system, LytTR family, sensor kinase
MMKKEPLTHACLWAAYLTLRFLNLYFIQKVEIYFWGEILYQLLIALSIYTFIFYVFPKFLAPRKYLSLFSASSLILILFVLLDYCIEGLLYEKLYGASPLPFTLKDFIFPSLKLYLQFIILGLGYYFAKQFQKEKAEKLDLENKVLLLEKEKLRLANENLEFENSYLRAQINPHFLFNTLNAISKEAKKISQHTSDQIGLLGEVMRYSLKKPNEKGRVLLYDEIEHINHLIEIFRLRYMNELFIEFDRSRYNSKLQIVPHILITLVENAFKHGNFKNPKRPILISLHVEDAKLHFSVSNEKLDRNVKTGDGFGTKYINRALALGYPEKYSLIVNEKDEIYTTELTLKLDL